ncbi:MAG: SiaB family protein kinase [Pseudomonadota bacterium]
MQLENLYYLKTELDTQGILFSFSGPISQTLLLEMGDTLRNKMTLEKATPSITLKVFSMLVEQTQNIIHYSAEKRTPLHSKEAVSDGIIVVGYENGRYYVLCGNQVHNNKVNRITNELTQLQNMDKEALKDYYKEQRRKVPHADSQGAGLGFIEMARRSVTPIEFNFQKVDDKFYFFSLKTSV